MQFEEGNYEIDPKVSDFLLYVFNSVDDIHFSLIDEVLQIVSGRTKLMLIEKKVLICL